MDILCLEDGSSCLVLVDRSLLELSVMKSTGLKGLRGFAEHQGSFWWPQAHWAGNKISSIGWRGQRFGEIRTGGERQSQAQSRSWDCALKRQLPEDRPCW
ncbi:hypothetical protein H1C71_000137 [Ictidomys tridecemlineatus]|nr:hypothetical protein H1C71_000137 [Ictidomys tridecemlineatus]